MPTAARQMFQTCLRINRLLKQHLAGFRDRRQDDLVKKIVQQFDAFLAAPAEGPAAGSFFVLAWRAEAYSGLAQGLDVGGPAVLPEAEKQYRQAVAAFQEILHRVANGSQILAGGRGHHRPADRAGPLPPPVVGQSAGPEPTSGSLEGPSR